MSRLIERKYHCTNGRLRVVSLPTTAEAIGRRIARATTDPIKRASDRAADLMAEADDRLRAIERAERQRRLAKR